MADDLSTINRRRVYSDGTDGTAATPLPVQAQQTLNQVSSSAVQPGTAAPVAPPVAPVAAPAAAAAAAAPITPVPDPNLQNVMQQPAPPPPVAAGPVLDPNLRNNQQPTAGYPGASRIPGEQATTYAQQVDADKARYAALPASDQVKETAGYYGGKALDSIAHNAPAFSGGFGGAASEAFGLARANALARVLPYRPAAATPGANFGAQAATAEAQAAKAAAPEAQAAAAGAKPGAAPGAAAGEPYVPPSASLPPQGGAAPGAARAATAEEKFAQDAVARAQKAAADRAAGRAAPAAAESAESAAPGATKWGELTAGQKAARVTAATGAAGTATAGVYSAGTPAAVGPGETPGGSTVQPPASGYRSPGATTDATTLAGVKNPYGFPASTAIPNPYGTAADAAAAAPANLNDITRVGNSYSGGPNISGDITVNGKAPGGTVMGGGLTPEQAAAAHTANMAGYASDLAHMKEMNDLRVARDRGWSGVIGTSPADAAFGVGMSKEDREKFHEGAAMNWATSKKDKTLIEAAKIPIEARLKREETATKNSNELAKTLLTTQAENARAAATDLTTRRGQDTVSASAGLRDAIALSGQKSVAQTAADKLDFEKEQKEKEYKRQVIKDGKDAADYQWKTRKDSMDDVLKMATEQRPYINGQPDKEGGARDAQAIQAQLDRDEATLQAAADKDPTNKTVADQLDKIKKYGARTYDQAKIGQIITGARTTNMANEAQTQGRLTRLWQGIQGSGASTAPFEGITKVPRPYPLPDIYVETDRSGKPKKNKDGGYTRSLPADAIESDSGIMGSGLIRGTTDPTLANIMH